MFLVATDLVLALQQAAGAGGDRLRRGPRPRAARPAPPNPVGPNQQRHDEYGGGAGRPWEAGLQHTQPNPRLRR